MTLANADKELSCISWQLHISIAPKVWSILAVHGGLCNPNYWDGGLLGLMIFRQNLCFFEGVVTINDSSDARKNP